jgi:hypothetical protein
LDFETSVFINCPFDEKYLPILKSLLFCIVYLGFTPRIALERLDSGRPRIEKIVSMIEESKYAIHDLSRIKSERQGEYFRLNMPFELGLDVGCRMFRGGRWATKRCLILETERYRYQAALSDLSSSDIAVHDDDPQSALIEVRNWLSSEARLKAVGPATIWGKFLAFMASNYDALKTRGFSDEDIESLPVSELIGCMQEWVEGGRKSQIQRV